MGISIPATPSSCLSNMACKQIQTCIVQHQYSSLLWSVCLTTLAHVESTLTEGMAKHWQALVRRNADEDDIGWHGNPAGTFLSWIWSRSAYACICTLPPSPDLPYSELHNAVWDGVNVLPQAGSTIALQIVNQGNSSSFELPLRAT